MFYFFHRICVNHLVCCHAQSHNSLDFSKACHIIACIFFHCCFYDFFVRVGFASVKNFNSGQKLPPNLNSFSDIADIHDVEWIVPLLALNFFHHSFAHFLVIGGIIFQVLFMNQMDIFYILC